MIIETKKPQDAIKKMDVAGKIERLPKTLEERSKTYAVAAAKPKMSEAMKPQTPGLITTAAHTLIISSRCVNHTSGQVVKAIRDIFDAREKGVGIKSTDLEVLKPESALPLIIVRYLLKINSDHGIPDSLKRQNGYAIEGIDWKKARVRCQRRTRNPLKCHLVLEMSPMLYTHL
ncbi:hypothetical protein EVAR_35539_1 [Eumeta japonica]|uniref:Uncharacterized protein n=1 Tax=Eumeta variegata TaxID=151549 RepID=A0A4C1X6U5_EUMVA|nr:hypothetical protein EVAR_35539_1 [Eumeta japonica]